MLLAEKIIGNPIFNHQTGNRVGSVKDIYLDSDLRQISGLYIGSEGVMNRTPRFIPRSAIRAMGEDSILVTAVPTTEDLPDTWLRRDTLNGREIDTVGGTKIGTVGDIILDQRARVAGFTLDRQFVTGPLADRGAFGRTAVTDPGTTSNRMTIDLARAERQHIAVESRLFQTDEVTTDPDAARTATTTPYAEKELEPLIHLRDEQGMKSPYVTTESSETNPADNETPYTSTRPDDRGVAHAVADEGYKSPYVTNERQPT